MPDLSTIISLESVKPNNLSHSLELVLPCNFMISMSGDIEILSKIVSDFDV